MPAISWDSRQESQPGETLSLGAPGPGGWGGEGNGAKRLPGNSRTGAVYSIRSGAFFGREAAASEQADTLMDNGHVTAGTPQAQAGQGAIPTQKDPEMIPFLSACFAELRAKGV